MDFIKLILMLVIGFNLFLGVGNYFATEFNSALVTGYPTENLINLSINETAFNDTAQNVALNPTLTNVYGIFSTANTILFGVPVFAKNTLNVFGAPDELVTIIYSGLWLLMAIIYLLFLLQIISYFTGGGT